MKTEDQYIQEKFYKNFIEGDCRNIVIYGTGIHTKKLLENIKTNRIVGLMDAAKTGEVMYGKKVLSNQETAAIRDVAIVIVARSSVIYVIYRRIQEFVTKNGIPVYDINGRQLVPEDINTHARECFQLKEKDLVSIIDDMAVVTFDIFDTLLCRTVLRPTDVFRLMDEKAGDKPYLFSEERVKAEQELGITDYNLDEIYHQIMENNGESEEEIRRLKELEIETETRVLRKRNTMCELLEYAHRQGKKVYLLSDMYISGEIIKEILYKKGIEHYDGLYVSTDYRTSKEEGLFEILKKENKIEVSEWLHIGDNPVSDINTAAKSGIKAYRIYGTVEMLEESIYAQIVEEKHSIEENMVIANFAAEAFNSPFGNFGQNGKLIVDDEGLLARLIIAPVIMKYLSWLMQKLIQNCHDVIFFPSRDGYVLKQIYDEARENYLEWQLPPSVYFYTSRRAALTAAAENVEDVRAIVALPGYEDVSERIWKRFDINVGDNPDIDTISGKDWENLLECCRKERISYAEYLEEKGFYSYKNIALCDFVAAGTVQGALERITNREIKGYFFLRRQVDSKDKKHLNCESLYPMTGDFQEGFHVYQYYYFLENILSSYEPSLKRIKKDGSLEFYEECRSEETKAELKKIHEAIMAYCRDMFRLCFGSKKRDADIRVYDKMLGFFNKDYMDISSKILDKFINFDELLGKKVTDMNR